MQRHWQRNCEIVVLHFPPLMMPCRIQVLGRVARAADPAMGPRHHVPCRGRPQVPPDGLRRSGQVPPNGVDLPAARRPRQRRSLRSDRRGDRRHLPPRSTGGAGGRRPDAETAARPLGPDRRTRDPRPSGARRRQLQRLSGDHGIPLGLAPLGRGPSHGGLSPRRCKASATAPSEARGGRRRPHRGDSGRSQPNGCPPNGAR
jgi:hypothetical protein